MSILLAAERLVEAARNAAPTPPVRDLLPAGDVDSAYQVQQLVVSELIRSGSRPVGRKIGLTSPAVQRQLGVDQPDFGMLLADMDVSGQALVQTERLLAPRIEAEIAFFLGEDLDLPVVSTSRARSATRWIAPALEIVDSRIADWDISIVDTIADNASSGLYVLGEDRLPLGDRDLREVHMTLRDREGRVVSSGSGAECLGDPVAALIWLAETAHRLGSPLRAGDVVLSGALGAMVPVTPGSAFTADITEIGAIGVEFAPAADRT